MLLHEVEGLLYNANMCVKLLGLLQGQSENIRTKKMLIKLKGILSREAVTDAIDELDKYLPEVLDYIEKNN